MSCVLVAGGTGNVGAAVAQYLVDKKVPVKILTRDVNGDKAARLKNMTSLDLVEGDMKNPTSLNAAFVGCDLAFLGCSNTLDQVQDEINFIDAAVRAKCRYLVKLGTCGTPKYTDLHSVIEYGKFHAQIEAHLERNAGSMHWTVLRPNDFMQNHFGDIFSGSVLAGAIGYPMLPEIGANIVDTRDVGAVAGALLTLSSTASHHGAKYDVCGPEAISTAQLASLYSAHLGRPVRAETITAQEWSENAQKGGFPKWLADAVSLNFSEFWAKGCLAYPSSPEVLELCAPKRSMRAWIAEHALPARIGVLGRLATPRVNILGIPFSANVIPAVLLALDCGAGELRMMDINKGENRTPAALAKNPFGQVPILTEGDFAVAQTNAILRYLAAKYCPQAYGGNDLQAKATIDWALDWCSEFYQSFGAIWYPIAGVGPQPARADAHYFATESEKAVKDLDLFAKKFLSASTFVGGEVLSIADYKIAVQCWYLGHPAVKAKAGFALPARVAKYVADFLSVCPSVALLDAGKGFMDSKL